MKIEIGGVSIFFTSDQKIILYEQLIADTDIQKYLTGERIITKEDLFPINEIGLSANAINVLKKIGGFYRQTYFADKKYTKFIEGDEEHNEIGRAELYKEKNSRVYVGGNKIQYLTDIQKYNVTEQDLKRTKGAGRKTIEEIQKVCLQYLGHRI